MAFAWRANLGTLVGWAVGLTVWSLIAGVLVPSMNDFIESDPAYQEILAVMGMDVSDLTNGFVAMLATIVGVALAVFAAWRIGAARAEEASARLELIVTRPVRRWRWLGGHILLTLVSVLLLATVGVVASAAVLASVLQIVGPALDWPEAVIAVSPFWHVATVPVESFEPGSTAVLVAIGMVAAAIGTVAFERRDLVGA